MAAALLAGACGGSGGSGSGSSPSTPALPHALTEADVARIVAQAAAEAAARGMAAHIVVTDRVGNVLATFAMPGAPATIAIDSGLGAPGALEGLEAGVVPATLAAIAKAVTGAYLSSQGNAFSTRTAGQIVQEHFNPQESQQPSGPLYGVQFSQLACSDITRGPELGSVGPKRSPLGLAADPGGLPLYKGGVLVGGIGVEADGRYGLDRDITDHDADPEEAMAVAGATGYAAPVDIRGDRITADGRTFRYVDAESLVADPAAAPPLAAVPGTLVAVPGYSEASIRPGTAFGTAASGIRADTGAFAALGGWVLVDAADVNRYPPVAGVGTSLSEAEVRTILEEGLRVALRTRGQIRRPLGSPAQVTVSVVDTDGHVLGLVRTADGPVFGIDVAVQKARTAMFFSHPGAAAAWLALPPAVQLDGSPVSLAQYLLDARAFLGDGTQFTGAIAWSARAVGNLHRPFYPDGIEQARHGPLSTPFGRWSPFNVGFQLDLVFNQFVKGVLGDDSIGCSAVRNGIQIFPGGVPIYRDGVLAGGIGVSGDGVDQDDMVAYLAVENAGRRLATGLGNAPPAMRADVLAPHGARIRYVQCPQAPFLDSSAQNVCD